MTTDPLITTTTSPIAPARSATNALMALAAVVVIVAGLRAASSLFVPFLLAGFIGLLCAPALFWLRDRGLPTPIALVVVLLGVGTLLVLGFSAGRRWQAYADMLRAAGEPLTLTEIEQRRPVVSDDHNGARILERMGDELAALKDEPRAQSVLIMGVSRDGGPPRETSADFFRGIWSHTIPPSRDSLEAHRAIMAELHLLDHDPAGRFEFVAAPSALDRLPPHPAPAPRAAHPHAAEPSPTRPLAP